MIDMTKVELFFEPPNILKKKSKNIFQTSRYVHADMKKATNLSTDGFHALCFSGYFNSALTKPGVAKLAVWMSSL
jgi:hypothetical protein